MRFVFLVLAGVVLGYALHALSGVRRTRGSVVPMLVARLFVFVMVVGWLARAYGPGAGLAAIVAAIVTRAILARERELVKRPDRGAQSR